MTAASSVTVPLTNGCAAPSEVVRIRLLPNTTTTATPAPLLDLRSKLDRDATLEPIQLMEGVQYRYEILTGRSGSITTDRPDIFEPDDECGRTGRLRPSLSTGKLPVTVFADRLCLGTFTVEVRSRKLNYLAEYRWMLRDIANVMTTIVMERFAATEQQFVVAEEQDSEALYQRFAFLRSILRDETLDAAFRRVLHAPYVSWTDNIDYRRPNQGMRGGAMAIRNIVRPGRRQRARQPLATDLSDWRSTLPYTIEAHHEEATVDNVPNRFLKFAISTWRDETAAVLNALRSEPTTAPVVRGITEVTETLSVLDDMLAADLFREVGRLEQFPSGNPVLLRRDGYRDIYKVFLQSGLAAQLSWTGGEDVYGAGQKNVAALYEFWAFLQLAEVLSRICGESFDMAQLVELQSGGLNVGLRRGKATVLSGTVSRHGRRIKLDLWFNKTFRNGGPATESWTRTMRPDCSLRLHVEDSAKADPENDVWVHFDAKYRIDTLRGIFNHSSADETDAAEASSPMAETSAKREDLLKMHAYRDAIRRSAGAYVIYPGDSDEERREYHEILPGVGAFALRPAVADGEVDLRQITQFLEDVITHIASQVTQYERSRYWQQRAFGSPVPLDRRVPVAHFVDRPPADTAVLLGYVKSATHQEWIERCGLYNLRADDRTGSVGIRSSELSAELVVLYGLSIETVSIWRVAGDAMVRTLSEMVTLGYPSPGGKAYFCLPLAAIQPSAWQHRLTRVDVERVLGIVEPDAPVGAPMVVSWLDLTQLK